MKLHLPGKNAQPVASTLSDPRKFKEFISTLFGSGTDDLTNQIFQTLHDMNRQTLPAKHRLENLEILRPLTAKILNNHKKHSVNRTLSLVEKIQKLDNPVLSVLPSIGQPIEQPIEQQLIQEVIVGYEIIADEFANNIDSNNIDSSGDSDTLRTSICRAINYLSEMVLYCSEVHKSCPENLWRDAHQLYAYAEDKKLVDDIVIDKQRDLETTIGNSYKQILLFTLAHPAALTQSDRKRVFNELFQWSQYADIQREASKDQVDRVFSMRTNEDSGPHYLSKDELAENLIIRTLDTSELISHIKTLIEERKKQKYVAGKTPPLETLTTLVSYWGVKAQRQFSRSERREHVNVAIGLSNIRKAMQSSINDSWNMRAKDRIQTDIYDKNKQLINEAQFKLCRQRINSHWAEQHWSGSHWQMVNISAGGYCLRWDSEDTSQAKIGELIALQEFYSANNLKWHIGIIRWMQFTQKNGLEIGVQTLSPKAVAATVQNTSSLNETPYACLILPDTKSLAQTASIILPSNIFKTNNKLVVQLSDNILNITLNEIKKHMNLYTLFTYKNTELNQQIKKQINNEEPQKNKDDFDELSSSLKKISLP